MKSPKTVFITGANRGIGLETARQLGEKGCRIYLGARRRAEGEKAAAALREKGLDVLFIEADIAEEASLSQAAFQIGQTTGHLDVLINNGAIFPDTGENETILTMPHEAALRAFQTNTLGAVRAVQTLLPLLSQSHDARIINVSSGMGALADMGGMAPAYSISKTALNAVTRQLAAVLKNRGIAVNSVCPGWVRTDMGGPKAERPVEKGAETIVWLASEAPRTLTGKFLRDKKEIPW